MELKSRISLLIIFVFLLTPFLSIAQQVGDLDRSFNYGRGANYQFNFGDGANNDILATAVQADGKIIIGGWFSMFNGIKRNRIARLNADGSLDTTFNPRGGTNGWVNDIILQLDGKIIIAGTFNQYNNVFRRGIARINTDGSLDATFNPQIGSKELINSVALQSDGKIIIGGNLTSLNGTGGNYLARLNANGSLDTSFIIGTGVESRFALVTKVVIQTDDKIIIGSNLIYYNDTQINRIARLNANGSMDSTFNVGTGFNALVETISLQPDGKVIIGGNFTSFNGVNLNRIARLNSNGTLDRTFNVGTGTNELVTSITEQPDGKVIIGGTFTSFNGVNLNRIARLNSNGTLDSTFNVGTGTNGTLFNSKVLSNGKILIAGGFLGYNETFRTHIALLHSNGNIDTTFNIMVGPDNDVTSVRLQPDGKIIIMGTFIQYNGIIRNQIARINRDGSLDNSFNITGIRDNPISDIVVQNNNKLIIRGSFKSFNGINRNQIARLNNDGSLDDSFVVNIGVNDFINRVFKQPDDKLLIVGSFNTTNRFTNTKIFRLNTDGSIDDSFDSGIGANGWISNLTILNNGKIIVTGLFTSYNGVNMNQILRLNANGSVDLSFNSGIGVEYSISNSALQPDGKLIIAGEFTPLNGISRNYIARLNVNGSLDASFNPGTGPNNSIYSLSTQIDGKIIIGGIFTSFNNVNRKYLARLNANGSLDSNFNNRIELNDWVRATAIQPDGNIIIAGDFTSINGLITPHIARLNGFIPITSASNSIKLLPLQLFPNPSNGFFTIKSAKQGLKLQLINTLGAKVTEFVSQEGEHTLNISHLPAGVYFLQSPGFAPLKVIKQ